MISDFAQQASLGHRPTQPAVAVSFKLPAAPDLEPGTTSSRSKNREISFQSKLMNRTMKLAERYARSSAAVLICGESGTGKELFSRLIHQVSGRKQARLVTVNCAAIAESLMESELFGHQKGAFTGASQAHTGYFEAADGGTLLLDEVSEIPLHLQAKLLRVIEEQEIQPVGGNRSREIDVRIVATTNRNLEEEVQQGRFRADLFHRLSVLDLPLPALRERVSDIPLLATHFLKRFAAEAESNNLTISDQAMQALCQYRWPGNVRELRNVMHRACVVCTSQQITIDDLPDRLSNTAEEAPTGSLLGLPLAEVEREVILAALKRHRGDKKLASEELGVTARTLSNKLKQYLEAGYFCQF